MVWQKQQIKDHRSGITDIIKNSPPSFQEECVNLIHDNKEGNLEQRAGSTYWTDFDAPSRIRQIFQLENYVFAYCYDDPLTPGDDIEGRIYWVLEDGTSVAWTEVETQGSETTWKIRLRDAKNKGIDIEIPEADPSFIQNYQTRLTTAGQNFPALTFLGGALPQIRMSVLESRLDSAGYYVRGDTGFWYDYEDLKTQIEATYVGFTVSYSPLTDATDAVHFSGSFAPDGETSDKQEGIGFTTGRWTETFKPSFIKEGHLSINQWSGILYLALEPFDKSFTPNDDDPYAENPDAFPPENNREPLRKLYLQNHDNVITPVLQTAQNSEMYLDYDYGETTSITTSDTSYRYARQTVRLLEGLSNNSQEVGMLSVYYERGFGPSPLINQIGLYVLGNIGSDRIDDNVNWSTFQPPWGTYAAYIQDGRTIQEGITALANLLDTKAKENTYGTPFRFSIVLESGRLTDNYTRMTTNTTVGGNTLPTLVKALPPEASGNVAYVYSAFMRTSFQAQDEGAPQSNINDNQVAFLSYPALSEIDNLTIEFWQTTSPNANRFITDKFPTIWLGRHKNYLYADSIHIPDTDTCVLARTEGNGTVGYNARLIDEFLPIGTNLPPDSILYGPDDWDTNVGETYEFTDRLNDDDITDNEPAYYNGGVASYDALPQEGSYYFTVVNQTGYHANSIGNVQRVYESPPGVPYAAPGFFFEDFDDVLTGISHFSNKPIIFTPNTCWRWEGTNGATGAGRTFTRVISDEFGCISNQSIVRTNFGLFFWSKTGICFTDGLKALRVTEHLIERYSTWLSYLQSSADEIGPVSLRGTYDEINRRVLWSSLDIDGNPVAIVLDVFEGVKDMMPVFIERGNTNVRWTGAEYETINMVQTSGIYFSEDNNRVYRAQDNRILEVSQNATNDEYWTGTETLSIPIRTEFKSVALDYGSRGDRKWTSTIMWGFEDLAQTGVSLQPLGWNDLSSKSHDLFPMVNYQHVPFSLDYSSTPQTTLEQFFLHTDVSFETEHIVSYKRKFPRNRIRNVFKQVGFRELPITLGDLTEGEGNVTDIQVIYRSGTGRNLVEIVVTVSDTGDNALIDLGLDSSGSFSAKWDNQDVWTKIHDFDLSGSNYTMQVYTSDESTNDFTYLDAFPVTIGRVFSDQKIKMSDYTLTFKALGDKTHGLVRSTEQGGFNG